MRDELDCPVCANIGPHYSNDGDTWQCEICMAVHDKEVRLA